MTLLTRGCLSGRHRLLAARTDTLLICHLARTTWCMTRLHTWLRSLTWKARLLTWARVLGPQSRWRRCLTRRWLQWLLWICKLLLLYQRTAGLRTELLRGRSP